MPSDIKFPVFPATFTEADTERISTLEEQKKEMERIYFAHYTPEAWEAKPFISRAIRGVAAEAIPQPSWLRKATPWTEMGFIPEQFDVYRGEVESELQELQRLQLVTGRIEKIKDHLAILALMGKLVGSKEQLYELIPELDDPKLLPLRDMERDWIEEFYDHISNASREDIEAYYEGRELTDAELRENIKLLGDEKQLTPGQIMSTVAFSKDVDQIREALMSAYPPSATDGEATFESIKAGGIWDEMDRLGLVPSRDTEKLDQDIIALETHYQEQDKELGEYSSLTDTQTGESLLVRIRDDKSVWYQDRLVGRYNEAKGEFNPLTQDEWFVIQETEDRQDYPQKVTDALSELMARGEGELYERALAVSKQHRITKENLAPEASDSTWAHIEGGIGMLFTGMGGALRWAGAEDAGKEFVDFGEYLGLKALPGAPFRKDTGEAWNRDYFRTTFIEQLAFSLSLVPLAIIGSHALLPVAGAVVTKFALGVTAAKVVNFIFAVAGAGIARQGSESILEAGMTYEEALSLGMTEAESSEAATSVYWNNMKLVGLDAGQIALAFAPTPVRNVGNAISRGLLRTTIVGGKLLIEGTTQAFEEYKQEQWTRLALDQEIEWDADMEAAVVSGFLMGLGFGGAAEAYSHIQDRTLKSVSESIRARFELMKQQAIKEGKGEQMAELEALGDLVNTPEGKEAFQNAVEDVMQEAYIEQIKDPEVAQATRDVLTREEGLPAKEKKALQEQKREMRRLNYEIGFNSKILLMLQEQAAEAAGVNVAEQVATIEKQIESLEQQIKGKQAELLTYEAKVERDVILGTDKASLQLHREIVQSLKEEITSFQAKIAKFDAEKTSLQETKPVDEKAITDIGAKIASLKAERTVASIKVQSLKATIAPIVEMPIKLLNEKSWNALPIPARTIAAKAAGIEGTIGSWDTLTDEQKAALGSQPKIKVEFATERSVLPQGERYEATLFRSPVKEGATPHEAMLGEGTSFTSNQEYAETYDGAEAFKVSLDNALMLRTAEDWETFTYRTRELRDQAVAEGKDEAWVQQTLREQLESEGYDGVVVGKGIIEVGEQVNVFYPEKAIAKPKAEVPQVIAVKKEGQQVEEAPVEVAESLVAGLPSRVRGVLAKFHMTVGVMAKKAYDTVKAREKPGTPEGGRLTKGHSTAGTRHIAVLEGSENIDGTVAHEAAHLLDHELGLAEKVAALPDNLFDEVMGWFAGKPDTSAQRAKLRDKLIRGDYGARESLANALAMWLQNENLVSSELGGFFNDSIGAIPEALAPGVLGVTPGAIATPPTPTDIIQSELSRYPKRLQNRIKSIIEVFSATEVSVDTEGNMKLEFADRKGLDSQIAHEMGHLEYPRIEGEFNTLMMGELHPSLIPELYAQAFEEYVTGKPVDLSRIPEDVRGINFREANPQLLNEAIKFIKSKRIRVRKTTLQHLDAVEANEEMTLNEARANAQAENMVGFSEQKIDPTKLKVKDVVNIDAELAARLYAPDWANPLDVAASIALYTGDIFTYAEALPPSFTDNISQAFKDGKFANVSYWNLMRMDTIRAFAFIDNGHFGGLVRQAVLRPTERLHISKIRKKEQYVSYYQDLKRQHNMSTWKYRRMFKSSKKGQNVIASAVELIRNWEDSALRTTEEHLQRPEMIEIVGEYPIEVQQDIVNFACGMRVLLDTLRADCNVVRVKLGKDPIPYLNNYLPHIYEANIWGRFFGLKMKPDFLLETAPPPDYIKPSEPHNPRALEREGGLKNYNQVRDIDSLFLDYAEVITQDMFYTPIIQNAKAHAAAMKDKAPSASSWIVDWAVESYAGVPGVISRAFRKVLPPPLRFTMLRVRRNLTRAVFPMNWTWNLIVQPSSLALTTLQYGMKNTIRGMQIWWNPEAKRIVHESYSFIIKERLEGSVLYQDLGATVQKQHALSRSRMDTVVHYTNWLTRLVERNVTAISIYAAYLDGQSKGLVGRTLLDYASEGGAKTQSMYNIQNVPGILRSPEMGAIVPFQTFAFEAFNAFSEMSGIKYLRAGAWHTAAIDSKTGQELRRVRLRHFGEFLVAAYILNIIGELAINRKPWEPSSALPFASLMMSGIEPQKTWNYPLPVRYVSEFYRGMKAFFQYGNWEEITKWMIAYHLPAGVQASRTLEGLQASIEGRVTDVTGEKVLYLIDDDPLEWIKAITMGVYQTEAGQRWAEQQFEGAEPTANEYVKDLRGLEDLLGTIVEEDTFLPSGHRVSEGRYLLPDFARDMEAMLVDWGKKRGNLIEEESMEWSGLPSTLIVDEGSPFSNLAKFYVYSQLLLEEYNKLTEDRIPYRKANPGVDAVLHFWYKTGTVRTKAAEDILVELFNWYGVDKNPYMHPIYLEEVPEEYKLTPP